MRQPYRPSRRTVIVFCIITALCALSWFVLGKTTFLARTAMYYAKPAIEKELNSKFVSSPFEGNPFTGFIVKNAAMSQHGTDLLTAQEIRITFDPVSSLLNLSPKINIEATGARTSVDNLNKLLPKSSSTEAADIIISNITLNDSAIQTQFGLLKIKSGNLNIKNTQSYCADLQANLEGLLDFSLIGAIEKCDGNWTADQLKLTVDKGSAELNGALYPVIDAQAKTNNFNLSKLTAVFPQLRAYGVRGILTSDFTLKKKDCKLETAGNMSLQNALIRGIPIENFTVKWSYGNGKLRAVFNDKGIKDSALTGFVNFDEKGKDSFIDIDLSTSKLKLATLTAQFKEQLGGYTLLPSGTIEGARFKLKGNLNELTGNIALLPSDISYGDLVFKKLGGSVVFNNTQKGNINFSTIHNGKPITLKGTLAFAPNVPTNMKFSAGGFTLQELYQAIPALKSKNAKGTVSFDAAITGTAKHWKLDAKFASPQMSADEYGTAQNFKLNAIYMFENGNIDVKNFSTVWNGGKFSASGKFDNTKIRPTINFSGNISAIQTERLYKLLEFMDDIHLKIALDGHFRASGPLTDPIIEARLSSHGGTIMKGLPINSASTLLTYKNNKIVAKDLNLITPHGTVLSQCEYNFSGAGAWSWDAHFERLGMKILNGLFGMNENIRGRAYGKVRLYSLGHGMHWIATFDRSRFMWRTFHFDSFTGNLNGTKDILNLDHVKFEFCKGKGVANGSVTIGNSLETSKLNVAVNSSDINLYEVIRRHLPQIRNIQGKGKIDGVITGNISNPVFNGDATLAPLRVGFFYIPEAKTDINASLQKLRFRNLSVTFPEGTAEGKAFLGNKNGKWYTAFGLKGHDIELNKLLAFADDSVRSSLSGKIDIDMHAKCPLEELEVKGVLLSHKLQVKGLTFERFEVPFSYKNNFFMVEDFSVHSNSGRISGGFGYDMKTNLWGAGISAEDFDIGTAFANIYGKDKPGKITGKASLKMRIGGDSLQLSSLNAAGTITATDGEISGFKFLDAAKKFTKGNPIRFSKFQSLFRYDNEMLILLPGTQAVAPPGDTVYRMATADGYITSKGDMSLMCLGKFNIRALNSILGGVSGIMDMTRTITTRGINNIDTKELLQSVLGGVLGGATRSSFRFVTIGLGGTLEAPKLTKLIVEPDSRRKSRGTTIPISASEIDERRLKQDGDITFNLHFEIPVGYGKNSEPGDFTGQIMQNALKSLISNITF